MAVNARLDAMLSRKFLAFVLVVTLANISLWLRFIDAIVYRDILIAGMSGYFLVNAWQKKNTQEVKP